MKIRVCLLPALALLATLPMNAELVDISTAKTSLILDAEQGRTA